MQDTGLWLPLMEGFQQALLSSLARKVLIGRVREYSFKHIAPPLGVGFVHAMHMLNACTTLDACCCVMVRGG